MKSLPSSGYQEIERCKFALVVALVRRRGEFWDSVEDLRQRWEIKAQRRVPPDLKVPHTGALHFPPGAPSQVHGLEEGWEEWSIFLDGWKREVEKLYDNFVPEPARLTQTDQSRWWWSTFLSACIVYDPPDTKLEEYADSHPQILEGTYDPEDWFRDDYPKHFMSRPPIVYTRREEGIERAYRSVLDEFALRIVERLREEPDADVAKVIWEVRGQSDLFAPVEADRAGNPTRAFIEARPWQKEKDVISAFRMISATQDRPGRRAADPKRALRAVQCAILHDRYGWKYEEIDEKYGWASGSNLAGKHIKDGRRLLSE